MNNITAEANQAARKATKDYVLEEVADLHSHEQIVTRETLADKTGRKLAEIDKLTPAYRQPVKTRLNELMA